MTWKCNKIEKNNFKILSWCAFPYNKWLRNRYSLRLFLFSMIKIQIVTFSFKYFFIYIENNPMIISNEALPKYIANTSQILCNLLLFLRYNTIWVINCWSNKKDKAKWYKLICWWFNNCRFYLLNLDRSNAIHVYKTR